jgi:RND superfamily putative drug exporter
MEALFDDVAQVEGVTGVASPYAEDGRGQIASEGPNAGQVAYADVELSGDLDEAEVTEAADAVRNLVSSPDGVQIELGASSSPSSKSHHPRCWESVSRSSS